MNKIQPPQHERGTSDRQIACREEIEPAMRRLVDAAAKIGWSHAEVAIALADASEDLVIELASQTASH